MRCFGTETDVLADVAQKYEMETAVGKIILLREKAAGFTVKVLFAGGFSAGKSALINALLQKDDFLTEGLTPETSVATEIMYGEAETAELHTENGFTMRAIKKIDEIADKHAYKKIICRVNNEFLRTFKGYVFVDMPGFDSANQGHDKAIASYAAESGNAYILCVNADDGTITKSVADEINEIRHYGRNFACLVTKADTKGSENLESIKENIEKTAELLFREPVPVFAVTNTYESAAPAVTQILNGFDVDSIFKQTFRGGLAEVCVMLISALEQLIIDKNPDNEKEDGKIRKLLRERADSERFFGNGKSKLKNKFINNVKPAVLNDVENALRNNAGSLASAAKSGGESFSRLANSIIRPALSASLQSRSETEIAEFIDDMSIDVSSLAGGDIENEDIAAHLTELIQNVGGILGGNGGMPGSANAAYKTVIGIAGITTAVVAPWIEVVLFVLPEIMSVLSKIIGGSPEDKITNEIIPQIIAQISPKIDSVIGEIVSDAVKKLDRTLQESLAAADEAIANEEKVKARNLAEYEKMAAGYSEDLNRLQKVKEALSIE